MNQTIKVGNRDAVVLVPENSGPLAVVDLGVLKRLTSLLPSVSFAKILQDLHDAIETKSNVKDLVELLEAEVAFHKSVNLIAEYNPNDGMEHLL